MDPSVLSDRSVAGRGSWAPPVNHPGRTIHLSQQQQPSLFYLHSVYFGMCQIPLPFTPRCQVRIRSGLRPRRAHRHPSQQFCDYCRNVPTGPRFLADFPYELSLGTDSCNRLLPRFHRGIHREGFSPPNHTTPSVCCASARKTKEER